MSNPNYTLEIISHHPTFKNKSLRKYYVDGIETIGAWGDEPFEIRFKNNTWQKVQVKLSLDGTDILTGTKANTDTTNDMWMVNGYGTLNLKAWPETSNGGAQFVFTSAEKSVAVHTHGDLSSRGIIAAAVFVEGHVEPIRVEHHHHTYTRSRRSIYDHDYYSGGTLSFNGAGDVAKGGGGTYSSNNININNISESNTLGNLDAVPATGAASSMDYLNVDLERSDSREHFKGKELQSLVSVGAGQHIDQKLSYVPSLIKPTFTETVRVRYLWWDDLVAKLRENNVPAAHASGFPGDRKQNIMSLGGTPRIGDFGKAFPRERPAPVPVQSYLRV